MTVGVSSSVDEMELRGISSSPQEKNKNYFMVSYFEQLSTIVERLAAEVCSENTPFVERSENLCLSSKRRNCVNCIFIFVTIKLRR